MGKKRKEREKIEKGERWRGRERVGKKREREETAGVHFQPFCSLSFYTLASLRLTDRVQVPIWLLS